MFELVGITNDVYSDTKDGDGEDHYSEEILATFDKKEDAEEYIEKSKLKKLPRYYFGLNERRFKVDSLLCDCEDAEIREQVKEYPPKHNPVYGKKRKDKQISKNKKTIPMSIGERILLDNLKKNILTTGAVMPTDSYLLKIIRENKSK